MNRRTGFGKKHPPRDGFYASGSMCVVLHNGRNPQQRKINADDAHESQRHRESHFYRI